MYSNSITIEIGGIMGNQTIMAVKFPKKDVENMDQLIDSGEFISRSDLVREGTRRLLQEQREKNKDEKKYVLEMEEEGVFKNKEFVVLASLLVKKPLLPNQKIIAKRLLKNPIKPVKTLNGEVVLTDIGKELADGFIESLLYLRKVKNVK